MPVRREFIRLVTSITESDAVFPLLFGQLIGRFASFYENGVVPRVVDRYALIRLIEWFTEDRGHRLRWYYSDVIGLQKRLYALFIDEMEGRNRDRSLGEFRDLMFRLHERQFDPFPQCGCICPRITDRPAVCLYRHPVEQLIRDNDEAKLIAGWKQALRQSEAENSEVPLLIARGAANQLVLPDEAGAAVKQRIASCYALHMTKNELANQAAESFEKFKNIEYETKRASSHHPVGDKRFFQEHE
jgi:hypothetical protein